MWNAVQQFVTKEDAACASVGCSFTVNNLLGYLLYRENYVSNRSLADIGEKLLNNDPLSNQGYTIVNYRCNIFSSLFPSVVPSNSTSRLTNQWTHQPGESSTIILLT